MSNIHQEETFEATPGKIYRALIDAAEFAKLTGAPATGGGEEGSGFSLFGGHITGRQIELVPDRLVVQAWRAKPWPAGVYSIVRFALEPNGTGTRVLFDHDGFPADMKDHLAAGWTSNYWEPMRKLRG
ncbi:MAG TPA: SRPBCC domain-containing protein [Polyangia bacterium]|jgi:activator of HSP90 ATPase|nr:SRPBCC domain-containing protein [Polyangia bacterium]